MITQPSVAGAKIVKKPQIRFVSLHTAADVDLSAISITAIRVLIKQKKVIPAMSVKREAVCVRDYY